MSYDWDVVREGILANNTLETFIERGGNEYDWLDYQQQQAIYEESRHERDH